jgi:glycosyltransferase involved in cell wall biosynthesis
MGLEISVVISTYNRDGSLARAIDSILAQTDAPEYELIVVDNNSTDGTARLVQAYAARAANVRYVFEPRQGVAYGRNAGVAQAQAPLIAFTDDDVFVSKDWLKAVKYALDSRQECGCVGGKVVPRWPAPLPGWLTVRHWAPLALLDYQLPQRLDLQNPKCLITANMAVRREVLDQLGAFRPSLQRTPDLACAIEDREFQERYWHAGGRCWFDPAIVVYADVQRERLTRQYHRRWHFSHGEMQALLRNPEFEKSQCRVLDVPGHVWRRFAEHSARALFSALVLRRASAFAHQVESLFLLGFIRRRLSERGDAGRQ